MNIFFISNGIWEFDGRLRELVKVALSLGSVKYITRVNNNSKSIDESHIRIYHKSYLYFIIKTIKESFSYKYIDVLFIDNRKAIIPALIVKILKKPKNIILDVRELYLSKEVKHLSGKIGCFFERIMIQKADIVICANKYRAEIMQEYYNLSSLPLVYENIRKIKYNNNPTINEFEEKYKHIFEKDTLKIISTSGYSVSRTNDKLVEALATLGDKYDLLLVGGGTINDKKIIQNIINEKSLSNVHLIEMVGEDELKYLMNKSQIGIVNYHQKDLNNKYCASGKLYEFLFEGLPVVTTENPPLKELCDIHMIGISDDNYKDAIRKIESEYEIYKKNVEIFTKTISVKTNNSDVENEINKYIQRT